MLLNPTDILQLANRLDERRTALMEEIDREVTRTRKEPYASNAGATPDSGEAATADLLTDVHQAEAMRDLGELQALKAARQRIVAGSYGICIDCGADIGLERLHAQPSAARCVECQRRHESTYRTSQAPRRRNAALS